MNRKKPGRTRAKIALVPALLPRRFRLVPAADFTGTKRDHLLRLVGTDGRPITAAQHAKARDKIGEVGSKGRFHFEMRPVDPQKFDDDAFAGRKPKAATTDQK